MPKGIPIAQGDRVRDPPRMAKQPNPEAKYHNPTANIDCGKNRHDANTPKLKINAHNPGSIQLS